MQLQLLFNDIHEEPVSSKYDPATMSGTPSSEGRTFDLDEAKVMLHNAEAGATVVIPIHVMEPEVTQEEINSLLFRDVLAERTTTAGGTSNRLHNIILASEKINGTEMNPGAVFSFNDIVGVRTTERGFREAGAFVSGRLVDQPGGGICQVSSTLYAAILLTHLEVVSRTPHGLTISYLPFGSDATVAWAQGTDFRFRNNTDFPIRIEFEMQGREITARLIGTKLDDTFIEVETVRISTTPFEIMEVETDELPIGYSDLWTPGQAGQVVETWQIHREANGNEISRTRVTRDTYRVQHRVYRHGIGDPENFPPE